MWLKDETKLAPKAYKKDRQTDRHNRTQAHIQMSWTW